MIETHLVQTRDLEKVMKSAKLGGLKDKRHAAFELASLAATGDDTKFKIVGEDGYVLLESFHQHLQETVEFVLFGNNISLYLTAF